MQIFTSKNVLLLDMNGTFMFGEDRFSDNEDYYPAYSELGGKLSPQAVNSLIRQCYQFLDECYHSPRYHECFPSVHHAIKQFVDRDFPENEINLLATTFARHEIGDIPIDYRNVIKQLRNRYTLALVIDIWAPKQLWLDLFDKYRLLPYFSAISFSSDHGIVKPSPVPMERLIKQLDADKKRCLMVGDRVERDLAAATAANIDCVLVGGKKAPGAVANYENLLTLARDLF